MADRGRGGSKGGRSRPHEKDGHRRKGGRPGPGRPDRGQGERRGPSPHLEPFKKQRLDLSRPVDEPLSPEEAKEMSQHLAFLRQFKGVLRLSLNAQEDLLVNGAKTPSDRGTCKHLLSKIDRGSIDRAITRDPLSGSAQQRAAFLAGIVRIHPDPDLLLRYLEAVSETAEKRDAARAFALTVDRLDFAALSSKQTQQILGVIARTFEGHDRVQALFGLLENETFRAVLGRALENLEGELADAFGPLAAAHRVVFEGEAPPDEEREDRSAWLKGVALLLGAPDAVLRGYPEPVRARLAELAIRGGLKDSASLEATRRLLASLPAKDGSYASLRRARVEQLLAAGQIDDARGLLNQLGPADPWARERRAAVDGKRVGPLIVGPPIASGSSLVRALWLETSRFVMARIGPPQSAAKLSLETRFQAELALPGVAPVIGHGLGADGTVFVAMPALGLPYGGIRGEPSFEARTQLALFGALLLQALATAGVVLPDLAPQRFVEKDGTLWLASFDGARAEDQARAGMAHGELAASWVRECYRGVELPRELRRRTSLRLLIRALALA